MDGYEVKKNFEWLWKHKSCDRLRQLSPDQTKDSQQDMLNICKYMQTLRKNLPVHTNGILITTAAFKAFYNLQTLIWISISDWWNSKNMKKTLVWDANENLSGTSQ